MSMLKGKNLVGDHFFSLFDVIAAGLPERLSNTIRYAHDHYLYARNTIFTPKNFILFQNPTSGITQLNGMILAMQYV